MQKQKKRAVWQKLNRQRWEKRARKKIVWSVLNKFRQAKDLLDKEESTLAMNAMLRVLVLRAYRLIRKWVCSIIPSGSTSCQQWTVGWRPKGRSEPCNSLSGMRSTTKPMLRLQKYGTSHLPHDFPSNRSRCRLHHCTQVRCIPTCSTNGPRYGKTSLCRDFMSYRLPGR